MRLSINAWLERRDPKIWLFDQDTGKAFYRLEADQVRALLESGEFTLDELSDPDLSFVDVVPAILQRACRV